MRELSLQEAAFVAGGNDTINARIADACAGLPDSANVTVHYQSTSGFSLPGFANKTSHVTVKVTVNCGDFRGRKELNR